MIYWTAKVTVKDKTYHLRLWRVLRLFGYDFGFMKSKRDGNSSQLQRPVDGQDRTTGPNAGEAQDEGSSRDS